MNCLRDDTLNLIKMYFFLNLISSVYLFRPRMIRALGHLLEIDSGLYFSKIYIFISILKCFKTCMSKLVFFAILRKKYIIFYMKIDISL